VAGGIAGVLVVVIIVGGVVVLVIRHLFLQRADKPPAGLTIEQVERLRADGALTAEEYKRARRALAGASNKQPAKDKPALVGKDDESAEPTQNGGSAEGNQDQGSGGQE
jgi:hypothetical protein